MPDPAPEPSPTPNDPPPAANSEITRIGRSIVGEFLASAGRKGGKAKSERKTKAVSANAQKAGRKKGSKDSVKRVRSCRRRKSGPDAPPSD